MCHDAHAAASNVAVKTDTPEFEAASQASAQRFSRRRSRLPVAIAVLQSALFLIHYSLYASWIFFWGQPEFPYARTLRIALAALSVSFVPASFLAYKVFNPVVRAIYAIAAVWLGFVNYFFLAACACWIVYIAPLLFGLRLGRQPLGAVFFSLAAVAGVYGVVNASWIRVVRVGVKLPNLPPSWRGRTAALVSDLHLGPVRNSGFLRRIVKKLSRLHPDILFVPGDLYDGTAADLEHLARPWAAFQAPLGSYFVTGNHEQF